MTGQLVDGFGRVARDLRLSLTDRCTLRCTYCMPETGMTWLPRGDLLTDDEILRLVDVAVSLGIEELRLTGGEPLLRPGVAGLVGRLHAAAPQLELSLTTNGLRLAEQADALAAAGLTRVNVSLDTVRPETFRRITRRDGLPDVLAGMRAASRAGLTPVKVNAVLVRGVNDTEAPELLELCLESGYELRFIESMPLDGGHTWQPDVMVSAAETLELLRSRHRLTPVIGRGAAPAEVWQVDGGPGTVGVIASVTRPFCGDCDRLRLTADGQLRTCLFAHTETDLRTPLRDGAGDAEIAALWVDAVSRKQAAHGIGEPTFLPPLRGMSAIGG